jgi:hypothetical protein
MVYGWMPTMLRLKGSVDSVYKAAYAAREGRLNPEIIDACSATLNNSLVGTTKLIHFIAPTLYPIWDSRVYRALYGKRPHPYRVEDSITYMRYLDWVCDFEEQSQFLDLRLRFEEEAGYSVSSKRVADAVLYALGPKPSKG